MLVLKIVLGIVYLIGCVALIVIILLQEPKSEGLSSVISGGASESFYGKNKGGLSKEKFLTNLTITLSVFFAVVAIILGALMRVG